MLFGRKYTSYEIISFYSVFLGKANNLFIEIIQGGWNILYKDYYGSHKPTDIKRTCYGEGKAAGRIVSIIDKLWVEN